MKYLNIILLLLFSFNCLVAQKMELEALERLPVSLVDNFDKNEKSIHTPFIFKTVLSNSLDIAIESEVSIDTFVIFEELFHPQLQISSDYDRAKKNTNSQQMVVSYFSSYLEIEYPLTKSKTGNQRRNLIIKKDSCIIVKFDKNLSLNKDLGKLKIELCYLKTDKSCPKISWRNTAAKTFKISEAGKEYFVKISPHSPILG